MWSALLGFRQVANRTTIQRPGVSLQANKLKPILRLPAGRDGMRAVVASFAVQPSMTGGLAI